MHRESSIVVPPSANAQDLAVNKEVSVYKTLGIGLLVFPFLPIILVAWIVLALLYGLGVCVLGFVDEVKKRAEEE